MECGFRFPEQTDLGKGEKRGSQPARGWFQDGGIIVYRVKKTNPPVRNLAKDNSDDALESVGSNLQGETLQGAQDRSDTRKGVSM